MNQPTPEELRNATFTVNRLMPGYDMAEVDNFLQAAATRMQVGWPAIEPHDEPDFQIRWTGKGYDILEVDRFLAPLYSTNGANPAGGLSHPAVTAEQVRNATFTKTGLQPGYKKDEVDGFLWAAADRMDTGQPAIDPDSPPTFNITRMGEGYDEKEVDDFLEMLYLAPGNNYSGTGHTLPGPQVTVSQVQNVNFTATRLRPGYSQDEVDELLDTVMRRIAAGLPPIAPGRDISFHVTRMGEGYDEKEVDDFLNLLYRASGLPPR